MSALLAVSPAQRPAARAHDAPKERVDLIDVALIGRAKLSIDLASCALTDPSVLDALSDAQRRGRRPDSSITTNCAWRTGARAAIESREDVRGRKRASYPA